MSDKHTPGPWELGEPTSQLEFGVYATDKISGIRHFLANAEGHMGDKESLANARLIAASPDLLEALQEVLPMLEQLLMIRGEPEPGSIGHKARAAIDKATGGAA